MGSAWAACQDVGKRYAAIVAGFMNIVGDLGGVVANLLTGFILQRSVNAYAASINVPVAELTDVQTTAGVLPAYQICFLTFAGAYALGVIFGRRSTRPTLSCRKRTPNANYSCGQGRGRTIFGCGARRPLVCHARRHKFILLQPAEVPPVARFA